MSKNKEVIDTESKLENQKHLEFEGTVTFDTKGCFKILLDSGQTVNAKPNGKMRKNKIQIITGDRVIVECSPYDLLNGFITRRLNSTKKLASSSQDKDKEDGKFNKNRDWK